MEGIESKDELERSDKEEIFSKAVRAGKRTYFFDVKATRKNDYYLTLTESKKIYEDDGRFHFEKHKIFLYKEDFEKFMEGLSEAILFVENRQTEDDHGNEAGAKSKSTGYMSSIELEDFIK